MRELEIKKSDRLLNIINKIITAEAGELKITIAEDSILFKNILNLKIFQRVIDNSNVITKIETDSLVGKNMLNQVRNSDQDEADFSKYQESLKEEAPEERILETKKESKSFEFPKFSLPSFSLSNLKMLPIILVAILLVGSLGYYFLVYKFTANVEILVSAERFVKSFEIKVSSLNNTDVASKILKGEGLSTVYQATKEISTTGKIDGGKKAEGEIKFLNKTDKIIKLASNTKLTFKDSGKEYNFILTEDVDVPTRSLTSTAPETFVSGEKTGNAQATAFGSSYNIGAGKNLTINGYNPTTELSAIVSSSFEGGVKNSLNAVSNDDLKEVSSQSLDDFKSKFVFNSIPGKVVLANSQSFIITSEKFSNKLSEPTDKISVTQDINVSYMIYDYDQALAFVKASMKSLIPDGYELYGKDLQIELSSLGSAQGQNINNKESTAQLTIKSYKIPVLDEAKIKSNLAGKKLSEVTTYLDSIKVNYNIESSSGLLNLLGFPKDLNKINVTVTKQ